MNTTSSAKGLMSVTNHPAPLPAEQKTQAYEAVRYNALKHGILSRYTVLSHESAEDYETLVDALAQEHAPAGATEQHLIEELASVIWRKRRVLQAEGATINRSLRGVVTSGASSLIPAAVPFEQGLSGEGADIARMMRLSPGRMAEDHENAELELSAVWKASSILRRNGSNAYEKARRALLPECRDCWDGYVTDQAVPANAQNLASYIHEILEPTLTDVEKRSRYQSAINAQTVGEGLQAHKLEQLSRYETHLDRKFERILAMLIKLKDLRKNRVT